MKTCHLTGGRIVALGCAALTVLAVSACGSQSQSGGDRQAGSAPLAFTSGVPIGGAPAESHNRQAQQLPAVLEGTTAYLAGTAQVRLVDAGNGREIATVRPTRPVLRPDDPAGATQAPVIADVNGVRSVLWPFLVRSGNGVAMELASINAGNHQVATTLVTLPDWASGAAFDLIADPVGAANGTVVINLVGGLYHGVLAVDAASGKTRWYRDGVTAGAVTGDVVQAVQPMAPPATTDEAIGLAVADGTQRWASLRGHGLTVQPAGPHLVAAHGQLPDSSGADTFQLLNATTGASVSNLALNGELPSRCVYDQVASVVCTAPADDGGGSRMMIGVDATTGHPVWSKPDGGSGTLPVPDATAAWRGVVYARGSDSMTTAYAAATGFPLLTSNGPTPLVVNDHAALSVGAVSNQVMADRPAPRSTDQQR
jgi:outer membrane protein assembly factor BamB